MPPFGLVLLLCAVPAVKEALQRSRDNCCSFQKLGLSKLTIGIPKINTNQSFNKAFVLCVMRTIVFHGSVSHISEAQPRKLRAIVCHRKVFFFDLCCYVIKQNSTMTIICCLSDPRALVSHGPPVPDNFSKKPSVP